jgi:predicted alpha/beta hydrolase
MGVYVGPDLGDHVIGSKLEQHLMEGVVRFGVGVLFRPDLNKRQRLETILILEKYIPEMFNYEHWEELTG